MGNGRLGSGRGKLGHRVPGDSWSARRSQTWQKLEEHLGRTWTREDGVELRIAAAGVDYASFTDSVVQFTKSRFARNVLGVKGSPTPAAPVVSSVRRNNRFKAAVLRVGTDQAESVEAGFAKMCHRSRPVKRHCSHRFERKRQAAGRNAQKRSASAGGTSSQ